MHMKGCSLGKEAVQFFSKLGSLRKPRQQRGNGNVAKQKGSRGS